MTQEEITLEFCNGTRGKTLNVYIHGYSAVSNAADKERLKSCIPARTQDCTSVFAFWPAEHIIHGRWSELALSAISPSPITSILGVTRNGVSHFKKVQEKVTTISHSFLSGILEFATEHDLNPSEVNLIGHSLGARLIIESILKEPSKARTLNIRNLVFLGGARHLNKDECHKLLSATSGAVTNIHSSSDLVLRIKPDLEKCIGRHPIEFDADFLPEASTRVRNHAFDWLGHMDYWENIGEIINYINLDGASQARLARSAPAKNTDSLDKAEQFATQDKLLFQVIAHATAEERLLLSRLIAQKRSASISPKETCPLEIAKEIQLMGGDSIANKTRGHGVRYSEVVRDAADRLRLKSTEKYGTVHLERLIAEKAIETAMKETGTDEQKNLGEVIKSILEKPESFGALSWNFSTASLGAVAGFLGTRLAASSIPVAGTAIGVSSIIGAGISALSGPAFSVTIPSIVVIHALRMKAWREFGSSFLFEA